jgi:type VI secretion system secreted protein Hcp
MAMDMFLVFDKSAGIKGETVDDKYKKSDGIDVLAWSWGVSNSGSAHMGAGAGSGKANFQDISFTKYVDLSSPALMDSCAKGTHITSAKLIVRKAGGKEALEYLVFELSEVLVSSYSTGGSGGEDRLTENVTLNFAEVKCDYATQQSKDGTAGPKSNFGYNIAAHTGTKS